MNLSCSSEPEFFALQRKSVAGVAIDARGLEERWSAPVAVIAAPQGFGEEVWRNDGPDTVIAWQIAGADIRCEWGRSRGSTIERHHRVLTLQPRGVPNHYLAKGKITFAQFVIDDQIINRVSSDINLPYASSSALREDLIHIHDIKLHNWLNEYSESSQSLVTPPNRLEMEARAILIVERLIVRHHAGVAKPKSGGLAAWQLKRTCDAMLAQLDTDIGLSALATIAGCSPTHFSRAFKQSMGLSPFHWLNERKIEKAKDLLAHSDLPLAEIALAVGFSAQPQFTTAFGRATGMAPGAWRRERLG